METVGKSELWSYFDDESKARTADNDAIRRGPGHEVSSYWDLASKLAEIQFRNPNFVLLFRGQSGDYFNRAGNSSLKPSLLRPVRAAPGSLDPKHNKPPNETELSDRFNTLKSAERLLLENYTWRNVSKRGEKQPYVDRMERKRLERQRILRWALLQHYDVCGTPLLDVTHSLRVAASFASHHDPDTAFVFVLAVPNLSGAITASADAGLQIVRLSSVCPPVAVRPHLQEGYLLGEYPDMPDFEQKRHYGHYEVDFGRRLLAKFRFHPTTFWKGDTFLRIARDALYPPANKDPFCQLAERIKEQLWPQTRTVPRT